MRTFVIALLAVLVTLPSYSQEQKIYKMGEKYGVDSSKASHRSFPKKLVMPKGAFGVNLQTLWLKLDASDIQILSLVSGLSGTLSYFRVAPGFCWAYANNNALGARFIYNYLDINSGGGTIRIFTDDLKFELKGGKGFMNTYGASVFNRSWFGLDDKGRIALFIDADLRYTYSDLKGEDSKAITNQIALGFSPGLEIFVLNNLACFLSLSFANFSYSNSKCYQLPKEKANGKDDWNETGSSSSFNAKIRLNALDLNLGLAFYF